MSDPCARPHTDGEHHSGDTTVVIRRGTIAEEAASVGPLCVTCGRNPRLLYMRNCSACNATPVPVRSAAPTVQRALEMIANGTAAMFFDQGKERQCSLCAAHIELARESLDWASLPEMSGVPRVSPSQAVLDVQAERLRQQQAEGWTPEHDDQHDTGELADAAGCYALDPNSRMLNANHVPFAWPWSSKWWKPTDRRRDLVKAGALILAEIERLDRSAQKGGGA